MFSPQASKEIEDIISRYPVPRSAILPALFVAQREYGWLSPEALEAVAEALNLPKALVKGVATFHTMFKQKPAGRNLIQFCTNITCMIFGTEAILNAIKEKYGLEPGGTTPDGRFTLVSVECIGACDAPPAMIVNTDFHTDLTPETTLEILERYG